LEPAKALCGRDRFEEIAASATAPIEEVRPIAHNLRPYHLDRLGLANSIESGSAPRGHRTVMPSPGQGTTIEIRLQLQKRANGEHDAR
jgi:signal transduction histidine kinase